MQNDKARFIVFGNSLLSYRTYDGRGGDPMLLIAQALTIQK